MTVIEAIAIQMEKSMKSIEGTRKQMEPVSLRVSRLFFVLTELININDMYQYSLEFFINIFESVLLAARG
jgi:dynein heavy chain